MSRRIFPTWTTISMALLASCAAMVPLAREAEAQEDPLCLSEDPNDWPASSKPYFLLVQDTSGSMVQCTNPATDFPTTCPVGATNNSCGLLPTRLNDAKCAMTQTIQAFSGQVNFGLETFAPFLTNCNSGACVTDCPAGTNCPNTQVGNYLYGGDDYGCTYNLPNDASGNCGGNPNDCQRSCGNNPDCDSPNGTPTGQGPGAPNFAEGTWLNGGSIVVPMKKDSDPDNTSTLLSWFDGQCTGSREIFARGSTPISGALQTAHEYFKAGWTRWEEGAGGQPGNYCAPTPTFTHATPLSSSDRPCRSINVLLVTDGDDTCAGQAAAVSAARELYNTGATFGGNTFRIRTYVVNFAGGSQANTDEIADAGDDGVVNGSATSEFAANEAELAVALANIISGTVAPEVCDNSDNNCNGCTDEGYRHYCDKQQTCCSLARDTCLTNYRNSITPGDPDGDLTLLPCTTQVQSTQPANWLCFNPGETCDGNDNNCVDGTDEGVVTCGDDDHCPTSEVCNGEDDDCDGVVDNGVCNGCVPQPEQCDGCDNDCNGIVDDNIGAIQCGVANPPSCLGTRTCTTPQVAVAPGQCAGNASVSQCSTTGVAETCNGTDDDCDGVIDDGIAPQACVPNGTPGGLIFTAPSQCRQGTRVCQSGGSFGPCIGFIGPSTEICDGVDNDCDGLVDAADPDLVGDGEECGINAPPACVPGTTQCVAGALSCVGAIGGGAEVCNGVDDDCDGLTDEAPLADAPGAGQTGCWTLPGNNCSFLNETWNAPPGADCTTVGTLDPPCAAGTIVCAGANLWQCQGGTTPSGEACDGIDNDCNGTIDDGSFPGEGDACGDADPPCQQGVTQCENGFLDCVGEVGPQEEVCDGVDNDCDTEVDEGIIVGTPCTVEYDTEEYPGDRTGSPCQPGVLQCDGDGGQTCVGGVGPSPEICDGIDNDCDGSVDETGAAPDGIDDTENPLPPPDAAIGEACGESQGVCAEGAWGCLNGRFECLGGQGPQVEVCDCEDNDCDGTNDNQNPNDNPRLCGEGKDCVKSGESCQCAQPCDDGEFPCPAGQVCVSVTSSETGEPLGDRYCVANACQGGCADKTVRDADDNVLCAPAGTSLPDCRNVPECVCKGQNGCQPPCFGVECTGALTCASFGEAAGTCAPNNCFNVGCQGCDTYCSGTGDCIANPCLDPDVNTCRANEVCEPDGEGVSCKGSCAGVDCDAGSVCKGGECVADCSPACEDGQVCDYGRDPATCVDSQCNEDSCPNGGCCDPLTGACGACPCEGIVCPDSQVCIDDECVTETDPTGTGGGATTSTGTGGEAAATTTGATGATSGAGGGSNNGSNGVFGLATGGGGCQCEVGTGASRGDGGKLAVLVGLGLAIGLRRRQRRERGEHDATRVAAAEKEVSR